MRKKQIQMSPILAHKIERFRQEQKKRITLISGIRFDDPFFGIPTPPLWGSFDVCWNCWKAAEQYGLLLPRCQVKEGEKMTPQQLQECTEIRKQFFKYARAYAVCMDHAYGLRRLKSEGEEAKTTSKKEQS